MMLMRQAHTTWQIAYSLATLFSIRNLVFLLTGSLGILSSCLQPKPIGKRVSLVKDNVSFTLPDSSLIPSKAFLWGTDCQLCSYVEAGGFYHNKDSSVIVSISITAHPNPEQRNLTWRILADEKRQREDIIAKNRDLAVIERFAADSTNRTVTIDYHMPKRLKQGWRGQASYEREFTFYGPQRTIKFWFFAPNNPLNRQAIAAACASVRINPTYLWADIKPYPAKEYRD